MRKTFLRPSESRLRLLFCSLTGLWALAACAAEPAAESNSIIHLTNGDYVAGRLVGSVTGDSLWWQSPAFASPFQFALQSVNNVQFPIPAKLSQPEGDYCFELAGGDVLFGSLIALQGNEAVLDASGIGRLHVDRTILRRMYRWHGGAEVLFFGPSGLKGWQAGVNTSATWREEAGNLVANQPGAVIRRDFGLPPQARFEFELSWKEKADFELALGANDSKSAERAFRFAIFDNELVIQRETEHEGNLATLQMIQPGPGHVHLQAFLDQQKGRILVFSSSGQQLADLTVASAKPQTRGGLQLTNRAGDIRLERLSIGRWNGDLPRAVESDKSRIHVSDGSIVYGQLKSYDGAQHQFTVDSNGTEQRIAEDQVQDVFFSQEHPATARALRAVYLSGQRVSGQLVKVEQNKVLLKSPGIREELASPLEGLQSLTTLDSRDVTLAANVPAAHPAVPVGRLELPGAVLRGNLAETEHADANCLVWKPARSLVPSTLVQGVSARIVYRDPPPPPKPPTQQQQARVVQKAGVAKVITGVKVEASKPASKATKAVLHLRSGDTIPCEVTAIDEKGVTFTSANTDATFIPHDQLKVLELFPDVSGLPLPKTKKERLLMLPRMQRDNPPTHLIRSVDGDYLRGRLVSMDEQQLQVEIRLETKALHRERVARIIWFHPDELGDTPKSPSDASEQVGTRVQALVFDPPKPQGRTALTKDGKRLTFVAEQVSGNILSGRSEFLGACRIDLQQIDQLLIGPAIEQAASTLAFHQWRLKSAADPLAARDDGGSSGDGAEGQDAALVGKMAPDFELEMLDGKKFHLSEQKGKIVVLDFWASWCGPCLQVMPQIDKVTEEFADRGVELVAINLEETNDRVQATLDRLKLKMPVALDRNGRTAEKYGATAIPQTVIIDRSGKVVRLFVGGGPRFGDQLRAALEAVLSDKPEKADEPEKTNAKPADGE